MTISDHAETFGDKPVREFDPQVGLSNAGDFAWRLSLNWDQVEEGIEFANLLGAFAKAVDASRVTSLVIGCWGRVAEGEDSSKVVQQLVAAKEQLRSLRSLFVGDMTVEECEISWIGQTDASPLLGAFPALELLRLRGGNGLSLSRAQHPALRSLIIETGGLPITILRELAAAKFPRLEHLELWLGDSGYGWDGTPDDVEPLLADSLFPELHYLGLRDSEIADDIAAMLAHSPILSRIDELDLSLGTLSDAGASALAAAPAIRRLKVLDISHHYLSDAGLDRLKGLGIEVRADDRQQGGPDDRYVAVAE